MQEAPVQEKPKAVPINLDDFRNQITKLQLQRAQAKDTIEACERQMGELNNLLTVLEKVDKGELIMPSVMEKLKAAALDRMNRAPAPEQPEDLRTEIERIADEEADRTRAEPPLD